MQKSPEYVENIKNELFKHNRISRIETPENSELMITCLVDSIQCTARLTVSRIVNKFGNHIIKSTSAGSKFMGSTLVKIYWESKNDNKL